VNAFSAGMERLAVLSSTEKDIPCDDMALQVQQLVSLDPTKIKKANLNMPP